MDGHFALASEQVPKGQFQCLKTCGQACSRSMHSISTVAASAANKPGYPAVYPAPRHARFAGAMRHGADIRGNRGERRGFALPQPTNPPAATRTSRASWRHRQLGYHGHREIEKIKSSIFTKSSPFIATTLVVHCTLCSNTICLDGQRQMNKYVRKSTRPCISPALHTRSKQQPPYCTMKVIMILAKITLSER